MFELFKKNLQDRKLNHLYREINLAEKDSQFSSNDYLNLSHHPFIKKQMIQALEADVSLSSKASRLLSGTNSHHQKTEKILAKWVGRDCALSFSSGYLANIGVLPALAKNKVIFSDELNHASLIDGIRLSFSPYHIYPHNDLNALENLLKKEKSEKIIVTESLFSMTGDFAPLKELIFLANKYNSLLFVDEAHSTGIFGSRLSGFCYDLTPTDNIISVHTCGKALASSGAFIACSQLIKDYLVNNCRSFIYTTAPSPLLMIQWQATLEVLKSEPFRALKLRKQALEFRTSVGLEKTESPILFINLQNTNAALEKSQYLKDQGFYIPAIRPPTVPESSAGLRVILQYEQESQKKEKLRQLLKTILDS